MYAAIRVRGSVNVRRDIKDTMRMLRLTRIHHCALIPETTSMNGMLKKVENFVTWGEIDTPMLTLLVKKRGRLPGDKRLDDSQATQAVAQIEQGSPTEIKPVFRLSPPSKGHKSIKQLYPRGACGYRGAAINTLLKRMI